MLIELLIPRRDHSAIELPDGSLCQFNENAYGQHIADVPNDQALIILRSKDVFVQYQPATSETPDVVVATPEVAEVQTESEVDTPAEPSDAPAAKPMPASRRRKAE